MTLREVVASNARAEIARARLQQADVARALGVTQQSVSLKIHGRRPLTLADIDALATLLGIEPHQLLVDGGARRTDRER